MVKKVNHNNNRLLLSRIFKVLSIIFSIPLILYGFFLGILGIGPDGAAPIEWQLIGVLCLFEGVMYWIPNTFINLNKRREIIYFMITLIPIILIIFSIAWSLISDRLSVILDIQIVFGLFFLSLFFLFSPISFFIFKKSQQQNELKAR